jgi:hypothetical protein
MDYDRIYDDMIARAIERVLTGYSETHHVIPRCVGGEDTDENLVRLTAREHFVAHQLLVKMQRYRTHPEYTKLIFAIRMMTVGSDISGHKRSNREYDWCRRRVSEAMSLLHKGKPKSPEHGRKIGDAQRGNTRALGLKRSDETRQKMSEALRGKPKDEEHRLAMSECRVGKNTGPRNPTGKPAWNRGKPHPKGQMEKAWATRRAKAQADPMYGRIKKSRDPEHTRKLVESRLRNKLAKENRE